MITCYFISVIILCFSIQTSSLPRAWNPTSHENKATKLDDAKNSSSSGSPPATPTLSEPMEKRIRGDTAEIYADGDDDSTDSTKLGVTQHNQSHGSIISMEDEEFASDDEKVK